jgi:hypothetical protein
MTAQTAIDTTSVPEHVLKVCVGDGGGESFEFTFRMDGSGSCNDLDCGGDPIAFAWDRQQTDGLAGEALSAALQSHAQKIFWEEINDQLGEERVLDEGDFGTEEAAFETGSEEELERIVRLVLYSFPSLWDPERDKIEVSINAATEAGDAEIDDYCELMEYAEISDEAKGAIRDLVDYALGWNSPTGSHLEYNDGAAGRASGYSDCPNTVWFSVPRPSFHELAEAREQLLTSFADHEARGEAEQLLRTEE